MTNEDRRRRLNALNFSTLNYIDDYLTSTETFPLEPIHPDELINLVSQKLIEFNTIVSNNTPQLITEMCKTFNYTIARNQANEPFEKLVMSPQTGSAKSLCAKAYVSLLKKETSLIVVQRVDTAIEYCQHINAWSGDKNYARCIYHISPQNGNHALRVDKEALKDFRCIVMTHNMFIHVNKSNEINRFKNIERKARDLVIIDERIKLYEQYTVHKRLIDTIMSTGHIVGISAYSKSDEVGNMLFKINDYMHLINEHFHLFSEISLEEQSNIIYSSSEPTWKFIKCVINWGWEYFKMAEIVNYLKEKKTYIRFVDNPLMQEESYLYNKQAKTALINFLNTFEKLINNEFFYYKDGNDESLTAVVSVDNHFGSYVQLDATAKINMYYYFDVIFRKETTKLIKTTTTKQYNNVTIHAAPGFSQGKKAITKNSIGKNEAKIYLGIIDKILEEADDKILVITSKDFRKTMQSLSTNKHIRFTHWGDHIGKNEWNDCNKVMIIGWYFFSNLEYYASFVGSNAGVEQAKDMHHMVKKVRHRFRVTQLADNLIQAVNRICIRNVIDQEGNCPKSDIYIFYGSRNEYQDVLDVFIDQFEGAKNKEWSPKSIIVDSKHKTKTEIKITSIITTIKLALKQDPQVLLTDIIKKTNTPKSTFSRLMAHDIFKQQCKKFGIIQQMVDKKSIVFVKLT